MPEPLVGQVSAVEVQPLEQEHPAEVGQPDAGKPVTRQVEFFEPGQLAEMGEVGVLNLTPRQDEGLQVSRGEFGEGAQVARPFSLT